MVGSDLAIRLHVMPSTDQEPLCSKEIRTDASGSFVKSSFRFARPGAHHPRAAFRTRSWTVGAPSTNRAVMMSPGDHFVALSSAARSAPLANGLWANQQKHVRG